MKLHRRAIPLLILLALAAPFSSRASADDGPCAKPLPFVLHLGLPRLPEARGFSATALERQIAELLEDVYSEHGACPGIRPLQVNITVATDYEILDWLGQGLIQAAVVPDLTLYLLTQRDGLDLRSVDVADHPSASPHRASIVRPALGRPLAGPKHAAGGCTGLPPSDLEDGQWKHAAQG